MAAVAWSAAGILSLPQFIVFHVNHVEEPGPFQNMTVCESIFRDTPPWVRQVYLTSIGIVVFYIPMFVMCYNYIRIFLKIAGKAKRNGKGVSSSGGESQRTATTTGGKVVLISSQTSATLTNAKAKILKMTIVIIACFILCGVPYHILEMIYSYGNHTDVHPVVAAIFGAMAVANSAVNPYVFLAFNANRSCTAAFLPCIKAPASRRSNFESTINRGLNPGHSMAATNVTDVSRIRLSNNKNVRAAAALKTNTILLKETAYRRVADDDDDDAAGTATGGVTM